MSSSISTPNPRTGLRIADLVAPAQDVPVRWSQLGVSSPAGVVIPSSEDEIIEALESAATNKLQVIPVGGALSPFVPINEKSLLLDMKRFKDISVRTGSVTIGGGSTAGDVIQACAAEGCYTLTPNSNAVGMVGFLLGGGSSPFNGIHGLAADHIISVRIITADGQILTLSQSSTGAEGNLFAALRGAGHGLGVITSVTMPTFRNLSLNMPDDSVWVRRVVFPLTAVDNAATAFLKLQEAGDPRLLSTIMFLRAPPSTPNPGEPIIALTASYYGPLADAERYAAEIFNLELLQSSITATTSTIPLHKMNDGTDFLNAPGGYKQLGNALLRVIDVESIRQGLKAWLHFGDNHHDAKARTIIFWASPTATQNVRRNIFLPADDRAGFLQIFVWYTERSTAEPAEKFMQEMLQIGRGTDTNNGVVARTLPNNQLLGGGIKDIYSEEAVEEIRHVKSLWDGNGLFWSPASSV
ncbi:hypothetical protein BDW59DRAFT_157058 [Aspergillus cavernicola]|uniref:FAD-binding PCMH-type domain-containing protein n=1 Tax=Aspergillus cavernicola TaxID=176166 RepID=A0ABR4IYT5_9EURO